MYDPNYLISDYIRTSEDECGACPSYVRVPRDGDAEELKSPSSPWTIVFNDNTNTVVDDHCPRRRLQGVVGPSCR